MSRCVVLSLCENVQFHFKTSFLSILSPYEDAKISAENVTGGFSRSAQVRLLLLQSSLALALWWYQDAMKDVQFHFKTIYFVLLESVSKRRNSG